MTIQNIDGAKALLLTAYWQFQREDLLVRLTSEEIQAWAQDRIASRPDLFVGTAREIDLTAQHLVLWLINKPSIFDKLHNA
ncbi:MAG: hypothetical protein ACK54F_03490 [Planctomycetia bacterium]|jgi:hypothetical protein